MFKEYEFEEYWKGWSEREESNYKLVKNKDGKEVRKYLKKGYLHFDDPFWFPERKDELKTILVNGLKFFNKKHERKEWWPFSPFLKILLKTPRYKYQEADNLYDLETKIRPICFASHIDGLIFGFYSYVLTRKYEAYIEENGFRECPLAYRSNLDGKCNIQFANEVFEEVKKRVTCSAIALDIKGYFDHIDHKKLKEKWCKVSGGELSESELKLYKVLTRYSYVSKDSILRKYNVVLKKLPRKPRTLLELVPGKKDFQKFQQLRKDKLIVTNQNRDKNNNFIGIPQGSGMSAILSNIFLIDFDQDLKTKAINEGFYYRRYCDDILIICDTDKAIDIQEYTINKISNEYNLTIQHKKVELTEFRKNSKGVIRAFNKKKQMEHGVQITDEINEKFFYKSLQYLGFEYNGKDIFLRSSSLSRYFRKMKGRIIKTVMMSYSNKSKSKVIRKDQIFERYSHLGNRNFLSYAYKASKSEYVNSKKEIKFGMNSPAIRKQVSRHFSILMRTLESKNVQRFMHKFEKGKVKQPNEV